MTGAPRPTILAGMSPAETVGLSVADIIAHVSALGSTIAALGIWFFGFIMWGQNRSRAAQAAKDAKATQAIMEALKDAAEDRKEMQKQAAEDRRAMQKQAAEDRKEMQERAAEDRKEMQERAAEDRRAMQEQVAKDREAISTIAQAAMLTAQAVTQEMTKAAERQEKTSEHQIGVLEALVTLAKSPDNPRSPARWGGPSQTAPTE